MNKSIRPTKTREIADLQIPAASETWPAGTRRIVIAFALASALLAQSGCGTKVPPTEPAATSVQTPATAQTAAPTKSPGDENGSQQAPQEESGKKKRTFKPVDLSSTSKEPTEKTAAEKLESIRAALKPFQVLLGRWNGLSRKTLSDQPEWAYDWVTNPKQPCLRLVSEKGAYLREGRLTYVPDTDQFELSTVDADGGRHQFSGTLIEPIRDVVGDQEKPQRTYKLQMTELEANSEGIQWRVTFNQQENNRYILELDRKRGTAPFIRYDTVHTQREGTSFAISDTDYGEKTCIISQGLGTISVSYQGQSFWVCCSGCKAAFEADPVKWITRWEEKKKSMKK